MGQETQLPHQCCDSKNRTKGCRTYRHLLPFLFYFEDCLGRFIRLLPVAERTHLYIIGGEDKNQNGELFCIFLHVTEETLCCDGEHFRAENMTLAGCCELMMIQKEANIFLLQRAVLSVWVQVKREVVVLGHWNSTKPFTLYAYTRLHKNLFFIK